jgi:hypothetical protein
LASTTSVPAFWMRSVSAFTSSSLKVTGGLVCAFTRAQHACSHELIQAYVCFAPLLSPTRDEARQKSHV